jgi:hypothetical protein
MLAVTPISRLSLRACRLARHFPRQVRDLVELERGMEQVVARQLATRLQAEVLERRAVLGQAPLEGPGARAQLPRDLRDARRRAGA